MRKLSLLALIAIILICFPSCKKEITPEERLMSDLKEILEDAYGKEYVLKRLGVVSDKIEISPEERLLSEMRDILKNACNKEYVLKHFGIGSEAEKQAQ